MVDISHLKEKFIEEAEVLLISLDNTLIELEKEGNSNSVDEVFRIIHTIKGASGMFGFGKVVEITHETESMFDLVRSGKLNLSSDMIELTFSIADHIRTLINSKETTDEHILNQHNLLKENILQFKGNMDISITEISPLIPESVDLTGKNTWNILFFPSDELIKRCINLIYTFQDLFALGEYRISEIPFNENNIQYWSIFLVTDRPYDEIEGALMFVLDYCKIVQIAPYNTLFPVLWPRSGQCPSPVSPFQSLL
ncbi:MAG TPA: Hpt domain-containing protein, partial [Bacteroidales bacterium]|nr:Hpt domain-containing protein [Bacteroidales bacterium]